MSRHPVRRSARRGVQVKRKPKSKRSAATPIPRFSRRARIAVIFGVIVVTALPIALTWFCASDYGPSISAHSGGGVPGTYRLTNTRCDSKCSPTGTFTANDPSGPVVVDIGIGPGSHGSLTRVGDQVPAVDVAGRIYPTHGGYSWIQDLIGLLVGSLFALGCLWFFLVQPIRTRDGLLWEDIYSLSWRAPTQTPDRGGLGHAA